MQPAGAKSLETLKYIEDEALDLGMERHFFKPTGVAYILIILRDKQVQELFAKRDIAIEPLLDALEVSINAQVENYPELYRDLDLSHGNEPEDDEDDEDEQKGFATAAVAGGG